MHSVSTPPAVVHVQAASPSLEQVLFDWCEKYDIVFGLRSLLSEARGEAAVEPKLLDDADAIESRAREIFRRRLPNVVLKGLWAMPSDPVVEAGMACLVAAADFYKLADWLADEWTPEKINQLDTLDAEADALAWEVRQSEIEDGTLPTCGWSEAGGRPEFDAPLDPVDVEECPF